ncbi:hypothetical protein [Chryseobacterium luquanense]|uniref:Uncharacterized protein n=1 Tax=Chryseobacterium luquanense TaxID=2983766 RepID=A0ABT3XZS7_9FLAO|nr:hypothetical protein [Chryseobacterium luquanense]MCX8531387.1 hypothetical protein [Chryseobacterium luquanense]
MNDYYDQITNEIKFPKPTPFYTLQINKQDCRVLIRINDIPLKKVKTKLQLIH